MDVQYRRRLNQAMWIAIGMDATVNHFCHHYYVENQTVTNHGDGFESRDTSGNTTLLVRVFMED